MPTHLQPCAAAGAGPGTRTLRVTVSDTSGSSMVVRGLYVADPANTTPPEVNLPLEWSGWRITAPIECWPLRM